MTSPLDVFTASKAIDVTSFVGAFPWRLQDAIDSTALRRQMDRFGVSAVCLSHLASVFGYDTRSGNEALLDIAAAEPRCWFTPVINPTEPGWQAELAWVVRHGARAVRIVPGYHGYSLAHGGVADLVAAAAELGLAIHMSATLEDPRERHPRYLVEECRPTQIADFLRTAGNVPVVISGLRTYDWDDVRSCLDRGHDLSTTLLDLWRMSGPVGALRRMCDDGWSGLLAYGTCQPVQEAVASAYQLGAASLSDDERSALAARNARRVLSDRTGVGGATPDNSRPGSGPAAEPRRSDSA